MSERPSANFFAIAMAAIMRQSHVIASHNSLSPRFRGGFQKSGNPRRTTAHRHSENGAASQRYLKNNMIEQQRNSHKLGTVQPKHIFG